MLKFILFGVFLFLLWRAVKPYVSGPPQLKPADGKRPTLGGKPRPANKSADEERIGGKLPHEVLGVARDATVDQVSTAYKKLVSEYHPDKAESLAPEVRKLMDERTKQINRAYEILTRR